MRFPDRLNIAVASMLTAAAIFVSTLAGPGPARWTAVALFMVSAGFFVLLALRGAGEVEVRFADDDTLLGFWDRLVIRRTINDCCLFLRRLGLRPPPVSPIIEVASLPIALTPGSAFTMSADLGTACMCSASSAPDTAGFVYQKPYHKIQIASAYTHCYIFRLFTRGEVKVLEGFPLIATRLMD